jgi:hypothetical protein
MEVVDDGVADALRRLLPGWRLTGLVENSSLFDVGSSLSEFTAMQLLLRFNTLRCRFSCLAREPARAVVLT